MPDFAPGEEDDSPLVVGDPYVRAEAALTDAEREYFLARFIAWNPSWNGAHVADILAEMENTDAHCEEKDEMVEEMGRVSQSNSIAIDIITTLGQTVTPETVIALSARMEAV